MTDTTDSPAYLAETLHQATRTIDVPLGDVDAVVLRGTRRAHRRHRGLAGLVSMALVASAVGAVNLLDGDERVSVASGGGLTRGDVGIEWRTVTPSSGLGWARDSGSDPSSAGGPLYALSTAPGQAAANAAPERVVWRSDDGVEWTAVSTLGGDLYLSDLATHDARVYAVGTGPATASAGARKTSPLLVGWSDDGARTWTRQALPLDLAALSGATTAAGVGNTAVAAGPSGTVVVARLFVGLDVAALLPAGATAPDGWALADTGVDVLGPARPVPCPDGTAEPPGQRAANLDPRDEVGPSVCVKGDESEPSVMVSPQDARGVVASYTWEQLQVDGDLLRAVRGQPFAFVAPPGSDRFERVDLPALDPVQGPLMLEAGDTGFDLVATTTRGLRHSELGLGVTMLHSDDGRTWTQTAAPVGGGKWATAAGRVGGVVTVVGQQPSGPVLLRADGAGGWTTTPLASAITGDVPADREVYMTAAAMGPLGIVAVVDVMELRRGVSAPSRTKKHVLVSRDGVTWEDHPLTELAGRPVESVLRASVVGERAVVAVSVPGTGDGRSGQIVLVGTPS